MKRKIPSGWFTFLFFIVLAQLLLILNADLLNSLFSNTVMPGWDGSAHMAIGKLYAENIFPWSWGWLSEWYLGMPFPQFYPPLFFFFVALLSKIFFFFQYETVFRGFVFFSLVVTPCLISVLGYKLSNNKFTAVMSGIMAVILLSYRGVDLNIGVGVGGTINTGLLANSLAFNFLVMWLINFLSERKSKKNYFWGVMFLAAVFLTNVHLVFPAVIFFFIKYIQENFSDLKQKKYKIILRKTFSYYLPYGLIALGLAAYWLLPMLARYDYFTTETLNIQTNVILYYAIIFSYVPFFFAMIFFAKRAKGVRDLTLYISVLAIFISFNTFVQFYLPLPLHVIRWLSPVLYLSAIPIADVFVLLYEQVKTKFYKFIWLIFVLTFLGVSSFASLFAFRNMDGIYPSAKEDGLFDTIDFLSKEVANNKNSLTLVEANTSDEQPKSFATDALLGQNQIPTVFSNLRESSMSGLYLVPLRNLFSTTPEAWGIQSFLAFDTNFLSSTTPKTKLELASYFGVSSIVTSTASSTAMLENNQKNLPIKKVLSTNKLSIFDISQDPNAQIVTTPLVAVFSDISLKDRDENKLSFSRLSEEWMANFDPNIILVRPNTNIIEDNPIFSFSKIVLLNNYKIKNFDSAKETLINFIRKGGRVLIVINSKEDVWLFNAVNNNLTTKEKKSLEEIDLSTNTISNTYKVIKQSVGQIISKDKSDNIGASILNFDAERNELDISLDFSTSSSDYLLNNQLQVLIKKSYFPDWKSSSGEVYLASPSFILFVPRAENSSIKFSTPFVVYFGYGISMFSFIILCGYSFLKRKNV